MPPHLLHYTFGSEERFWHLGQEKHDVIGIVRVIARGDSVPAALRRIILFGVRSPIVVEYEDVCTRLGIAIIAGVSLNGAPRLIDPSLALPFDELDARHLDVPFIPCAFAPARRRSLTELAVSKGMRPAPALVDPSATVSATSRVRQGTFINGGVVVGALSIIGSGCLINRSASIGHHSIIEDYVSIGPGATLASNIRAGEGCLIGAGATLLPNVVIGAGTIVAAGALVRKSVGAGVLVSGNPATEMRLPPRSSRQHDDDE